MFFRDEHQSSIWPKTLVAAALGLSVLYSVDILFGNRLGYAFDYNPYRTDGDVVRDSLLLAGLAICLLRTFVTLFVFYRRTMYWREALIIANIMPWCLIYFAYFGGQNSGPIGWLEVSGIVLFLFGSYLNSASEYGRYRWKSEPANAGRLYTKGLFAHVRHVNYTGDVVMFSGLALVAHNIALLLIPFSMAFIFMLVLVPLKEVYLRNKYGREFEDYATRTKMIIPLVI